MTQPTPEIKQSPEAHTRQDRLMVTTRKVLDLTTQMSNLQADLLQAEQELLALVIASNEPVHIMSILGDENLSGTDLSGAVVNIRKILNSAVLRGDIGMIDRSTYCKVDHPDNRVIVQR